MKKEKIKMHKISKKQLREDLHVILTHALFGHHYKVDLGERQYVYVLAEDEYRKLKSKK